MVLYDEEEVMRSYVESEGNLVDSVLVEREIRVRIY